MAPTENGSDNHPPLPVAEPQGNKRPQGKRAAKIIINHQPLPVAKPQGKKRSQGKHAAKIIINHQPLPVAEPQGKKTTPMKSPEEAEAQGLRILPTLHSMKRRAPWHNYHAKSLYMITLVVDRRKPVLGTLEGLPRPHVRLSDLGYRILNEEIPKIGHFTAMQRSGKR